MTEVVGFRLVLLVLLTFIPIRASARLQPAAAAVNAVTQDPTDKPVKKKSDKKKAARKPLTQEARLEFIRKAQVWAPTNVPQMDLRAGPQGPGAFQPNESVTCDYMKAELPGTTKKFDCAVANGDVVKVRYGQGNGKVEGAVLGSRLLWALGFGADRLYPVRVTCRGCSTDPWRQHAAAPADQVSEPAAIERKPKGHEMKSDYKGGWKWPELDLVDEAGGGVPKAQRDGLEMLAVFMQHSAQ